MRRWRMYTLNPANPSPVHPALRAHPGPGEPRRPAPQARKTIGALKLLVPCLCADFVGARIGPGVSECDRVPACHQARPTRHGGIAPIETDGDAVTVGVRRNCREGVSRIRETGVAADRYGRNVSRAVLLAAGNHRNQRQGSRKHEKQTDMTSVQGYLPRRAGVAYTDVCYRV